MIITTQKCAWYTPVFSRYYHVNRKTDNWQVSACWALSLIASVNDWPWSCSWTGRRLIWTRTLIPHGWTLLQARLQVICNHQHLTTVIYAFQIGLFHGITRRINKNTTKIVLDPTIYWVGQWRIRLEKGEKQKRSIVPTIYHTFLALFSFHKNVLHFKSLGQDTSPAPHVKSYAPSYFISKSRLLCLFLHQRSYLAFYLYWQYATIPT